MITADQCFLAIFPISNQRGSSVVRTGLIVDDFVGQGETLANLIGYIESQGGHAAGTTVLPGKPYSGILAPDDLHIQALRNQHGREFED